MPYIIPSSAVTPGTVYQPGIGVPGYITANARALACVKGGALSSTHMLDQSPRNNGTRRTGEEGRCYTADGTDDEVNYGDIGSAIWFSGWVKLNSDDQCLFSLSNDTNTNLIVSSGVLTAGATLTLSGIKLDNVTKTASEAGALLNDNLWHFLSCGIGDGLGGASTADDVRFFTDGTNHGSVSGFDWRFWTTAPTAAELTEAYSGATANRNSASLSKYALWSKMDEQSGTTSYDSSGNDLTGTITNATLATFHATQDIWSFQNNVGYNLSGSVYIPRDESDPTNDVLGNPLTYTGKRPNDFKLNGSNCLTADGTLYIAAAHLVGTETVVSSGGTSTPTISAGRIDFTAGTCWDLTLSDGTHYPLSEGGGIGIHDDSGSGNHGVLTSATLATAWGGSQDDYHNNIIGGHGKRMYFDGVGVNVQTDSVISSLSSKNYGEIEFNFIPAVLNTYNTIFAFGNAVTNSYRFSIVLRSYGDLFFYMRDNTFGGFNLVWPSSAGLISVNQKYKFNMRLNSSGEWSFYLNDIELAGDTSNLKPLWFGTWSGSFVNFWIGRQYNASPDYFTGIISDFKIYDEDFTTVLFHQAGYGNTDSDWIDLSDNGNDGTVNGSPSNLYLPAKTSSVDIFDQPLTHPAGDYHNDAETTVDFNPDSTPEMGATQLGITVPSAHAFGDAFAASDQIFSRQRSKTEDRFLVFPEAQTGSALTNIQKYTQP